jgi:hypothetical protein
MQEGDYHTSHDTIRECGLLQRLMGPLVHKTIAEARRNQSKGEIINHLSSTSCHSPKYHSIKN